MTQAEEILEFFVALIILQEIWVPIFVQILTLFVFCIVYPIWRIWNLISKKVCKCLWIIQHKIRDVTTIRL